MGESANKGEFMEQIQLNRVGEYFEEKAEGFDSFLSEFEWAVRGFPNERPWEENKRFLHKRLLVVDDEESIRDTYTRLFTNRGYDVLSASNAVEAKAILVNEKVDLIFLDINMPDVDGETLYDVARAFHKNVKIIVSSVYPVEEQQERIKDADAYFDKSQARTMLLQMVTALA